MDVANICCRTVGISLVSMVTKLRPLGNTFRNLVGVDSMKVVYLNRILHLPAAASVSKKRTYCCASFPIEPMNTMNTDTFGSEFIASPIAEGRIM